MKLLTLGAVIVLFLALVCAPGVHASDEKEWPCYSIRESKLRGAFVCMLDLDRVIDMKDRRVFVKEAWIEKQLSRGPLLGMLSVPTSGYNICIVVEKDSGMPTWYLANKGASFTAQGTVISYQRIDKIEPEIS